MEEKWTRKTSAHLSGSKVGAPRPRVCAVTTLENNDATMIDGYKSHLKSSIDRIQQEISSSRYHEQLSDVQYRVAEEEYNIVDSDNKCICSECGLDHSFKPDFTDVRTSIETMLEILNNNSHNRRSGRFK